MLIRLIAAPIEMPRVYPAGMRETVAVPELVVNVIELKRDAKRAQAAATEFIATPFCVLWEPRNVFIRS